MTKSNQRRVLVTVSPEMYELVHRLGKEAHVATSQLLGQMIEEARPAFEAMLEIVVSAKSNGSDGYLALHRALIAAHATATTEVAGLQLELLDRKMRRIPAEKDKTEKSTPKKRGRKPSKKSS